MTAIEIEVTGIQGAIVLVGYPVGKELITDANGKATFLVDNLFNGILQLTIDGPNFAIGTSARVDAQKHNSITVNPSGGEVTVNAPVNTVSRAKKYKNVVIDQRTKELIGSGFSYGGKIFSTSQEAQTNWLGAHEAKASITYPLKVSTIDDGEHEIADILELEAFYMAGMGFIQGHLDSGRALKQQVNAATTIAAVNAIVDDR